MTSDAIIHFEAYGADLRVFADGQFIGQILRDGVRPWYRLSAALQEITGYGYEHRSPRDFRPIIRDALAAKAA